ncbi:MULTISPECIES: hypothetical protein [unclassified Enterococcus]|uniref:hypothetical protein n=1 Tax=unclassified Enterococcus TaxID=2608891 RepID=UPI0013EA9B90|nr:MULTISPECIES: hypothetical protein [unclassified Enterococcus]
MRFQWLKDYQELEEQILYYEWNLNKSKLELARWISGDLSNVRLNNKSRSSSLEEKIEKISNELVLLNQDKDEMLRLIKTFKGLENEIIRMKYIEGLSLEQVAEKTRYSASYIRKKHAEIRGKLDFLDEYEASFYDRQKKKNEIDYYDKQRESEQQISLF